MKNILSGIFLGWALAWLAACGQPAVAPQHIVEWPEARLLFVADGRNGSIAAYSLQPHPVPLKVAWLAQPLQALALDEARGRLWAADGWALHLLDARTLAPRARWPLPAGVAPARLELDAAGQPLVHGADGLWLPAPLARNVPAGAP